ncbi:hypothetical protein AMECASPLE_008848 [Ameca splendens]|uniref:Secreted protein n=1 Tax=Ameca splendens TaxID=208324 RepID=A0ABV0YB13_9TELE
MRATSRRRRCALRALTHIMLALSLLSKRQRISSQVGSRLVHIHTRRELHQSLFGSGLRPPQKVRLRIAVWSGPR